MYMYTYIFECVFSAMRYKGGKRGQNSSIYNLQNEDIGERSCAREKPRKLPKLCHTQYIERESKRGSHKRGREGGASGI